MNIARTRTRFRLAAGLLAVAMVTAACGGGEDEETVASDAGAAGACSEEITIAAFNGWDESIAASYLWQSVLEDEGYEANVKMADAAPVFAGLAGGDYDLTLDVWLPSTHEDYVKQYGDELEDLGTWYDNAKLTIAVNEDSPATSLADLAENAEAYGNRLIGIEPGAGLTRITNEKVIPTYGLEGMEYIVSSTPAMLAELKGAVAAGEDIAVTLWRPHWAYDEFPIRDLEDPEGALGDAEEIHSFARAGFSEDCAAVADMIGNFTLSDEQLGSLENLMFNENEGEDHEAAVDQWLEKNPEFVETLKA
jgi:glycine betaine/proline transport system substrate-binding protein